MTDGLKIFTFLVLGSLSLLGFEAFDAQAGTPLERGSDQDAIVAC